MNEITSNEWYEAMVEDCRSILIERLYRANRERIECFWEIGQRITNDENYQKYSKGNSEFLSRVFKDIGISQSQGYRAIQFFEKYPADDVSWVGETFEEGKNISWSKICNKYLPGENGEQPIEETCDHDKFMCCRCKRVFSREELKG